jgi:uncharacterized protein
MKRDKFSDLALWKTKENRLPLVLQGARQVGKTHLLKTFGEECFEFCHHFDFERQADILLPLFGKTLEPAQLLQNLSLLSGRQINPGRDLVIFDEIQNCPRAITSLKYFCEDLKELHLCAAGSILGLSFSDQSFPVGKIEYLDLYPMNFGEFLEQQPNGMLKEIYHSVNSSQVNIPSVAHQQFWELLKCFYVTGGMPAAVKAFLNAGDSHVNGFNTARQIQENLLRDYMADMQKHCGKINALHIASVFKNIPLQLSQTVDESTGRYRFKDVIPLKKGYTELEGPIAWLEKAGLVHKSMINNRPELPLRSFCKPNLFKLFYFDHGMLAAALNLPIDAMILQDYGISKGYFSENFVAHELMASGAKQLYCWMENNSEIEFLQVICGKPVPIEVKSGHRTQAKSLMSYIKKYEPTMAIKISAEPYSRNGGRVNLPLYLAGKIFEILDSTSA